MSYRLSELAELTGTDLVGDGECLIERVDTIEDAEPGAICFLANSTYQKHLASTRASAVVLSRELADKSPIAALVSTNPYLDYARISSLLNPEPGFNPGIHPSAVIAESVRVDPTAYVGPCSVVESGATIGAGAYIGPGCVISRDCQVGQGSRLVARVTLCHGVRLGERVLVHPGAVIGSDGFGLANDQGRWVKVPQIGSVQIGSDVEIGANTTIDRGALRDTVIADGVKLDNQIQVAHNVRIGEHSAIAGCAGISGSTTIGRHCTVGGGVGIAGHLEIGDHVHLTGQTLVTRSFKEPGAYSGNLPAVPNADWRKAVARIRRLDQMAAKIRKLEKQLEQLESSKDPGASGA